jgi:hypothetical protein
LRRIGCTDLGKRLLERQGRRRLPMSGKHVPIATTNIARSR